MRKCVVFLILWLLGPVLVTAVSFDITSDYVYYYNVTREEVLYEEKMAEEIAIASLTKIMTAWVAIENIDNLDEKISFPSIDFDWLKNENAAVAGFKANDKVTYRDLLYGLMLPSGADAALALSKVVAGSEKNFAVLMNEKVAALGLKHTHFVNAHGLDIENHYSSAEDIATILRKALENEEFKKIFAADSYRTSSGQLTFTSYVPRVSSRYDIKMDYILGSKTGYTYDAGQCLASLAEHDGELYILVTANAEYRDKKPNNLYDTDKIYRYFFDNYSYRKILTEGEFITTIKAENDKEISFTVDKTKELYLPNDAKITSKYTGATLLTYGMKTGEVIGTYSVYADDKILVTMEIILTEDIKRNSPNILWLGIVAFVIAIVGFFVLKKPIRDE